jgi:antitoxin ParD1/3/4
LWLHQHFKTWTRLRIVCFKSTIKYAHVEAPLGAIERLTITLPANMTGLVKGTVNEGDYASTSEVIREALRDWKLKRELRLRQLAELKADIDRGLSDVAQGRLADFDVGRIIARGRKLLADRSNSDSPKRRK